MASLDFHKELSKLKKMVVGKARNTITPRGARKKENRFIDLITEDIDLHQDF